MQRFRRVQWAEIDPPTMYRPEEAAVKFEIPYGLIIEAIRRGHLAATTTDRVRRVSGDDLRTWVMQTLQETDVPAVRSDQPGANCA